MKRAFSLPELVLAMALFGLVSLLIFSMLLSGTRSFNIAMSRSTLQGELNRSLARLQGEVRRSSVSLVGLVQGADRQLGGQSRDGICLSALRDWRAPASYDAQGTPLWDEFVLYYATMQTPGRLLRRTFHPAGAPYVAPMTGLNSTLLLDQPGGGETSVLAQHLEEFKLRYDGGAGVLEASLLLRRRAGRTPQGQRVNEERVQAACRMRLNNP
ncbi:hypothetical protein ABS71_13875 [bacterium SCN 62-11]|nr:prepilin-type N-terminal cleavage/methylation domain-containing protein [Candidatus Eremiobacteraeota bacterium]ODT63824.1 MAG: hypothetical protein ABS71_13875 [bacterium SCN 62-11]